MPRPIIPQGSWACSCPSSPNLSHGAGIHCQLDRFDFEGTHLQNVPVARSHILFQKVHLPEAALLPEKLHRCISALASGVIDTQNQALAALGLLEGAQNEEI